MEHGDVLKTTLTLPQLGDNVYEVMNINISNVRRITFVSERSGAVVFIRFKPGHRETKTEIIEVPYNIISVVDADTCFDPVAWCEIVLFDILLNALKNYDDLTPEEFDVILNGLQAMDCDGAASAVAAGGAVVHGGGTFKLRRGGRYDTVDQITLNVTMDAATLALADVDANGVASANAFAYAFAKAQDCSKYQSNAFRARLCALAKGEAQLEAIAIANAFGSGTAVGTAGTSTDVDIFVDARKINEFDALVSASVSRFAAADASATARAFASAYAAALAKIKISTKIQEYHCCLQKTRHCNKVCRYGKCKCYYDWKCMGECGWWATNFSERFTLVVEPISADVERSFATAHANSLAAIDVKMNMRAYFKDEYGTPDVVMFKSDNSVDIDVATRCIG